MLATLMSTAAAAQPPASPSAARHIDPVNGLSLDQAIARALDQEPSLLAARSQIDVARGMREQSSLRPNPIVSFERREEPQGMDNQTMVSLEWPLDLFRRDARVAVADRQVAAAEFAIADRRRLLVAAVRTRYGEVLAADYRGAAVGHKRIFRFAPSPGGIASYFQEDGASARKAFLKSPLKFAQVTSGFGSRVHPVLRYRKEHNGVDYAASVGTPVWAIGDGTVVKAAYDGAAGKHVCLRHLNQLETCYLHLSAFGVGVRVGARVQQKQVIAYTGTTGRSTGPHLHFALKKAGAFINPLKQASPRAEPVAKAQLPRFKEEIARLAAQLDGPAVVAARR
jgi:murein DD-endopeptidase MepM/ murein hydrolase activator NlpD